MSDAAPLAAVTGQQDAVIVGPDGKPLHVIRITFKTTSGYVGTVDVPTVQYSVEAAREAIRERATTIEQVAALTVS